MKQNPLLHVHTKRIAWFDNGEILGGAELFSLEMIEWSGANNSAPIEIYFFSSGKNEKIIEKITAIQKNLPKHVSLIPQVIFLPKISKISLKTLKNFILSAKKIRKILKEKNINLIYSNTARTHLILGIIQRFFLKKIPSVAFIHDYSFPKKLQKFIFPAFTKIFACSYPVKNFLVENGQPSKNILVIENGVDEKKFSRFPSPKSPVKTFGILGRIASWKGQMTVLQAARRIKDLHGEKNFSFIFFGEPSQKTEDQEFFVRLQHFVEQEKLEKIVQFNGFTPLKDALKKSDVIIHAAEEAEPFGRVPIESAISGRALLCSKIGTPEQIFTDQKNTLFFTAGDKKDLAEKIIQIAENHTLREKIAKNAKEMVKEKFTLEKISKKFWENV